MNYSTHSETPAVSAKKDYKKNEYPVVCRPRIFRICLDYEFGLRGGDSQGVNREEKYARDFARALEKTSPALRHYILMQVLDGGFSESVGGTELFAREADGFKSSIPAVARECPPGTREFLLRCYGQENSCEMGPGENSLEEVFFLMRRIIISLKPVGLEFTEYPAATG